MYLFQVTGGQCWGDLPWGVCDHWVTAAKWPVVSGQLSIYQSFTCTFCPWGPEVT